MISNFNKVVFRRPLMKFSDLIGLLGPDDFANLFEVYFKNQFIQEAIFIASPDLYHELEKLRGNNTKPQKMGISLLRYLMRMSTRSTPFGLFAGFGISNIENNQQTMHVPGDFKRITKLDMQYILSLCHYLSNEEAIFDNSLYSSNSSLYVVGNQYRYVEYFINKKHLKTHILSSIDQSEIIDSIYVFTKSGRRIEEIVDHVQNLLDDDEVDKIQILDFVKSLIKEQFLVTDFVPTISGMDPVDELLDMLATLKERATKKEHTDYIGEASSRLEIVRQLLVDLDLSPVGTKMLNYDKVIRILETFGVSIDKTCLFQVDTFFVNEEFKVSKSDIKSIYEGVDVLSRFTITHHTEKDNSYKEMNQFIDAFYSKYEDQEVPLALALDRETGVQYSSSFDSGSISENLAGLKLTVRPVENEHISWNQKYHSFWLEKYTQAIQNNNSIHLSSDEVQEFTSKLERSPETFSQIITVFDNTNTKEPNIVFNWGTSDSAPKLLGRFCAISSEIHDYVKTIGQKEEELTPGFQSAEVIHSPELRVQNILRKPPITKYEIPFLSRSSKDEELQIAISDLMLSIKHGKVFLRSKSLNRYILPKLYNAHNYPKNALPVYQFLCQIQNHYFDLNRFHIDLGFLFRGALFIPRISYKNVILSRALWVIKKKDVKGCINDQGELEMDRFREFCIKRKIPRYFIYFVNDLFLFVDRENRITLTAFIAEFNSRTELIVREFPEVYSLQEGKIKYANELIVSFYRNSPSKLQVPKLGKKMTSVRKYSLGSEWAYLKVYSGFKFSDILLVHIISPLIHVFVKQKLISEWFFIRYNDPDSHLRIRFKLNEAKNLKQIINEVNEKLCPVIENGQVDKVQWDTYQRELERYGDKAIEDAETIFRYDSDFYLELVNVLEFSTFEEKRWLIAFVSMNNYLRSFNLNSHIERLRFVAEQRESYAKEFGEDRLLRKQLAERYRKYRVELHDLIEGRLEDHLPSEVIEIIAQHGMKLKTAYNNMASAGMDMKEIKSFIPSYLHMHINRFFASMQRFQEYFLYDMLTQSLKEAISRRHSAQSITR